MKQMTQAELPATFVNIDVYDGFVPNSPCSFTKLGPPGYHGAMTSHTESAICITLLPGDSNSQFTALAE